MGVSVLDIYVRKVKFGTLVEIYALSWFIESSVQSGIEYWNCYK